ncbi:MAG TPA: hypothetical protein DCP31_13360 [Cyanobacteria bacterium UBA8543]|nr:hypothetical protein [Cyanobacteria bacterium UBA8543]
MQFFVILFTLLVSLVGLTDVSFASPLVAQPIFNASSVSMAIAGKPCEMKVQDVLCKHPFVVREKDSDDTQEDES